MCATKGPFCFEVHMQPLRLLACRASYLDMALWSSAVPGPGCGSVVVSGNLIDVRCDTLITELGTNVAVMLNVETSKPLVGHHVEGVK